MKQTHDANSNVTAFKRISSWRSWCWPIERNELSKFLPLFLIKLCLSFNYTILAATKDTIVVTTSGGAEVIPVLKGGVVIVIAFLAMLLYSKLSNLLTRANLFYLITGVFLAYFLLYGVVLFPYRDMISPHGSADWLLNLIGANHQHWIAVYRHWMNTIFFVAAELWGGMMIAVMFWGFANQVTNIKDAVRFYALFSAGGHLGTIFAGGIVYCFANYQNYKFETTVLVLMLLVVSVGFVSLAAYYWFNKNVLSNKEFIKTLPAHEQDMQAKTKLSLRESIAYIMRSKYLGLIALMVIGYGLSVNLVEVTWKAILQIRYPDSNDYQAFMGGLQFFIGITSLFVALLLGSNVLRKFGWRTTAQITPIILGITSVLFFGVYFLCPDFIHNEATILSFSPLMLLVIFGTIHNISCKTMKYCLFDTTKEMAYIPLEPEAKIKGKAAVDLVGSRFGKSGASWLQLGLIDLVGAGSILGVVPLLVPFVLIVVVAWLVAVNNLHKRFSTLQLLPTSRSNVANAV